MTSALILQVIYCTIAYSDFRYSSKFIYLAIAMGMVSQLIWGLIVKISSSTTQTTKYGIMFDSIAFLIWGTIPLIFAWSKFNSIGLFGIALVMLGMLAVGFQDQIFNIIKYN